MAVAAGAAVFLVAIGWPLARTWLPRGPALLVAPAATVAICVGAAMAALALRSPLWPWLTLAIAGTWAYFLYCRMRSRPDRARITAGLASTAAIALAVAPALRAIRLAPMEWDARSIWWLHAEFLWAGGRRGAPAFGNAVFEFSHPDYPPASSATVAGAWTLNGGHDLWLAQAVVALLTIAGLIAAAAAICALAPAGRASASAVERVGYWSTITAIGASFSLAAVAFGGDLALRGDADLLWSAWIAAAAVLLLAHPPNRAAVVAAAFALGVAMLAKNEGMSAGFALVGLAALRHRARIRSLAPLLVPSFAAVAWVALTRSLGAESDIAGSDSLGRLLRGDSTVLDRVAPALRAFRDWVGAPTAIWFAIAAVGVIALWRQREGYRIGSAGWLPALTLAVLALALAAYVISPYEIGWHLATSVNRVMIAPRVLLAADIAVWAVVAAGALFAEPAVPADRPAVVDDMPEYVGS